MKQHLLLAMVIFLFTCCTHRAYVSDAVFENKHLPFIKDKLISRKEVIKYFGEPTWVFENGRILTYRLLIPPKGPVKPMAVVKNKPEGDLAYFYAKAPNQYSLVLIFDKNEILEKHSLVKVIP